MAHGPRATAALLWFRAAVLAVVVVTVSAVGHVSADGLLPGVPAMAGLVAATALVVAAFLTREVSAPRLVALVVGGQAVVHGALTVLAGHAGHAPGVAASPAIAPGRFVFDPSLVERTGSYADQVAGMQEVARAGHGPGVAGSDAAAALGQSLGHLLDHLAGQGAGMLAAHLAAATAVGIWLAAGERALWALVLLATTCALAVVARALVSDDPRGLLALQLERVRKAPHLGATRRLVVPAEHLSSRVVAHRGPPALLPA